MSLATSWRCPVCDLLLSRGRPCPNYWCGRHDRGFEVVWSIGEHSGQLRRAIAGLKYRGEQRWVPLLGRLLANYLLDQTPCFDDIDLIVGTPGNIGPARPVDHVTQVLTAARLQVGGLWAIDVGAPGVPPLLAKRAETRPMASTPSAAARRLWAAGELRAALVVTDPTRVTGRRVLAVDDVFTDGSTLREVAIALRSAGATAVSGLAIARAPLAATGLQTLPPGDA